MAAWTQEQKDEAIKAYLAASPTSETSTEIIKEIADDMDQSANGVRMILVAAGVYVKKEAATKPASTGTTKSGEPAKRVSKESSIAALTKLLTDKDLPVDEEILSKLTGKAAVYLLSVVEAAIAVE